MPDQAPRRLKKRTTTSTDNGTALPTTAAAAPSAAAPRPISSAHRFLRRTTSTLQPSSSAAYTPAASTAPSHARSPTLPSSRNSIDCTVAGPPYASNNHYDDQPTSSFRPHAAQPRYSVTEKHGTDLLGQRFDSLAVLGSLDAIPYEYQPEPLPQQPPTQYPVDHFPPPRPSQPDHSHTTGSSPAFANPTSRLSQSLAAAGRRMEEIQPRGDLATRSPRQRYSDEARESNKLKKKSGFSSFMNNLVGTPRKPTISAPENPVHVTHVGYDSSTGEFTVCALSHG